MFNLEEEIADWRRQMLVAGIKTPTPLVELEGHLREEIERQVNAGLSEAEAFRSAAQRIGQASALKSEFRKIEKTSTRMIGIFAVVIGAVIILRILARYRDMGNVWGKEQLEWFLFGVALVFSGLSAVMLNFTLGDTRDVRLWKLVATTYSIFAVGISMVPVCSFLTVSRFSTAFSLTDRILVFSAMAVSLLSIPGWRYGSDFLPIISTRRTRAAIGVACCSLGVVSMSIFWLFVFPQLGHWHALLVLVLTTWAWTVMAILGGVGYGLAEAARIQTEAPVESTHQG